MLDFLEEIILSGSPRRHQLTNVIDKTTDYIKMHHKTSAYQSNGKMTVSGLLKRQGYGCLKDFGIDTSETLMMMTMIVGEERE